MDYQKLSAEMDAQKYIGLSDYEVSVSLNTENIPVTAPVPYTVFQPALMQMALWPKVRMAALSAGIPDDLKAVCIVAIDLLLYYRGAYVDTSLATFQAAMGALHAAGIMSYEEKAAIDEMATVNISRATQLGLGPVGPHHVAEARGTATIIITGEGDTDGVN